jgi:S-formylglutathione hydrolase FrmB
MVQSTVEGPVHVNVLLPENYDPGGGIRYPVLYLLHGSEGSYLDWASTATQAGQPLGGDVEARTGSLPLIVVMPDDSTDGSYSDWYGVSRVNLLSGLLTGGLLRLVGQSPPAAPAWETFDISELIPWVDATFPTKADAAGRAIAGVSSGGGGAAKDAADHPGLFGYVGTFSGAVDNDLADATTNWYLDAGVLDSGLLGSSGGPDPSCTFGDPYPGAGDGQQYYWRDNDPTAQAANLAGTRLWVASGNGTPGPVDAGVAPAVASLDALLESVVDDMSRHFVAALHADGLGAEVTTDFYGDGLHTWAYWQADLTGFLAWLEPQLSRPVAVPASFSFQTARVTSGAWGWSFTHRSGLTVRNVNTAESFVYLTGIGGAGFTAAGHGTLGIVTPAGSYEPGSTHTVTVGSTTRLLTAGPSGSLAFSIRLGPGATRPQSVFPDAGPPVGTPTVHVSIG